MATHSSILAGRIPQTGSLVGCSPWGRKESNTTEATEYNLSKSHVANDTQIGGWGGTKQINRLQQRLKEKDKENHISII